MTVLKRSASDRVLFGVCGGIAEALHVDADLLRAGWIVFGAWGGIGLVPYVAALLLLPEADTPPDFRPAPRRNRNLGLALIAAAVVFLFLALGLPLFPVPGLLLFAAWKILVPTVLLAAGVFLVWPKLRERVGFTRERRFFRSSTNRLLAGVCAGLGLRLGVDPNLVRILAVLFAFVSAGAAVLVYVVLVVVVPEESGFPPDQVTPEDRR